MFREKLWERKARECLDKIDPIDSLAFDVSVARHAAEEADYARVKKWLDPMHASGELFNSLKAGFLLPSEQRDIGSRILTILEFLKMERYEEAHKMLVDLQEICMIKAYLAFTKCVVLRHG